MFSCRMYEQELPEVDDLVVVKITKVEDESATCQLLEYNNLEGILPCAQYSKKYIRSIRKLIKPGRQYVLSVINVNPEKGYVDLSKKHVTKEEIEACNSKFKKSTFVHSFLSKLARHYQHNSNDMTNTHADAGLITMYQNIGWPLYREYEHAYDGLQQIATRHELLTPFHLSNSIVTLVHSELDKKFAQKPITYTTTVNVSCAGVEGVKAIKEALCAGQDLADKILQTHDETLEITVVKPPEYMLSIKTTNQQLATDTIEKCTDIIQKTLEPYEHTMFHITS